MSRLEASTQPLTIDATILDGADIVQLLAPGTVRTFLSMHSRCSYHYVKQTASEHNTFEYCLGYLSVR